MTSILTNVTGRLQREIKQTKPFASLEEEVILNLARTAEYLGARAAEVFKRSDLTGTQYNVLRILRGAGSEGLSCREIGERMVTTVPDVTRLLDRREAVEDPEPSARSAARRIGLKIFGLTAVLTS